MLVHILMFRGTQARIAFKFDLVKYDIFNDLGILITL